MKSPAEVDILLERFLGRFFGIPTRRKYHPNVTFAQVRVLLILKAGKINLRDLSRKLNMTSATICEIVSRLAKQGMIRQQTDAVDRRVKWIFITSRGLRILRQLARHRSEKIENLFRGVGNHGSRRFVRALTDLNSILDEWENA